MGVLGAALLAGLLLAGCGGGSSSSSSTQAKTTGLKKRVLLSNQQAGSVVIVDAQNDKFSASALTIFGAGKLVTGGGFTAVLPSGQASVAIIDDSTEQIAQQPALPGAPDDIAITPDGKTVLAAVHNLGQVEVVTSDGTVTPVTVPSVSRIVLSPNGTKLLAFSDNPHALTTPDAFFVIDVASKTATTIAQPASARLDQPFTAVFNSSETQAFILNCGAQCGGGATTGGIGASVVAVDFSNVASPVFSPATPLPAATAGVLSGGNLFIAGTPPAPLPAGLSSNCAALGRGQACGALSIVNISGLVPSPPIAITDGLHQKMRVTSNGRVYIGASTCTPINDAATGKVGGCLSIFNSTSNAVVVPEVPSTRSGFNVTGLQPISNRNVIYVCQGGELDIYDITTDALTPAADQLDVVGKAIDVVQIDP